ncbi:alpha/beta fold hydrolase [Ramlibacter sp. WS9]|nr:alpha/beta fold hydrolase [Ramlibacter sp. WS9]
MPRSLTAYGPSAPTLREFPQRPLSEPYPRVSTHHTTAKELWHCLRAAAKTLSVKILRRLLTILLSTCIIRALKQKSDAIAGDMNVEHVRANGILMRCQIDGPANGRPLLLCNGLATDMSMWDRQVSEFAADYRVIRYDLRGHGETSATVPPYSLSLLVEDLRSFLDALGLEQVHFVGMSLGGMVGQSFAARYPNRLLSLVLCDTTAKANREIWEGRIQQVRLEGVRPMVEPSLERWFTEPFRQANAPLIDEVREMIKGTAVEGYLGGAGVVMEQDQVRQLHRISAPTLIIVGREDVSTPPADAEVLHKHITGSTLHVVDNAAHLPNIEQPEVFNKLLKEFLTRLDGVAAESRQ